MRKMITSRDGFQYWCMSLVILVLGISQPAFSIPLGQIDDFEDGTALGWAVGAFSSIKPMVVETGGPAGAGDNYLELSARGGNGAGSRLAIFNRTGQWNGSFTDAEVTTISLNLINLGDTDLSVRLGLNGAGGTFVTTESVFLSPNSGWQSVVFPLLASDLTASDRGGGQFF